MFAGWMFWGEEGKGRQLVFIRRAGRDFEFHKIPENVTQQTVTFTFIFPCFLVCKVGCVRGAGFACD